MVGRGRAPWWVCGFPRPCMPAARVRHWGRDLVVSVMCEAPEAGGRPDGGPSGALLEAATMAYPGKAVSSDARGMSYSWAGHCHFGDTGLWLPPSSGCCRLGTYPLITARLRTADTAPLPAGHVMTRLGKCGTASGVTAACFR
jgi:hypothetical protein